MHILQSEFFAENQAFLNMHKVTPDPRSSAISTSLSIVHEGSRLPRRRPARAMPDVMFATVMTHGLASDYLGLVEKRYLAALSETKLARATAERLLAAQPAYYDAYLAIGVENYMLSLKPAPVRWLLRVGGAETDKQAGIEKVHLTAEKGHYLLPFARLLLAVAALRDKNSRSGP